MIGPQNLSSPLFSGRWCDENGNLTALAQACWRRIWERTGYATGTDTVWIETQSDAGLFLAALAGSTGSQAFQSAREALDEATILLLEAQAARATAVNELREAQQEARMALLEAQVIRAEARKALEEAQNAAILVATARMPARDGSRSDESMVREIMIP